jgi:hypothetical protein
MSSTSACRMGYTCCRGVRLKRLPRMADFALWATACESAFRPAGTLETAYSNNRRILEVSHDIAHS